MNYNPSKQQAARRAGEDGFSLLETLIALAIMAGMTGMFFQTLAQDALARRATIERRAALLVAQSQIERAAAGELLTNGRNETFIWRIERTRAGGNDPLDRHPLEQIRVTVADPDGKPLVRLATLRIAS